MQFETLNYQQIMMQFNLDNSKIWRNFVALTD